MKILEMGPGWNIEQMCTGNGNGGGGCNSKLLVEVGDIYVTSSCDITGEIDYYYTFTCPICGVKTDISKRNVPSNIQRMKLEIFKDEYTMKKEL